MFKAIAFDFDGTLCDSVRVVLDSFHESLEPVLNRKLTDAEIFAYFGLNEEGVIRCFCGQLTADCVENYYAAYDRLAANLQPYPGIPELLRELKARGVNLAVITGKGERTCNISLKKLGIFDDFFFIGTGLGERPNKADLLKTVQEKLSLHSGELAYVGDALTDIDESRKAGVPILSAAWCKTAVPAELERRNPGLVFPTVASLQNYLLSL